VQSWNYVVGPVRSSFKHDYIEPEPIPQICVKSRELAEKSLNRNLTWGSYDQFDKYLSEEKKQWEARSRQLRVEKENKDLWECTFAPEIHKLPKTGKSINAKMTIGEVLKAVIN